MEDGRITALKKLAEKHPICDHCIGRMFPSEEGKTVEERGKNVRKKYGVKEKNGTCYFCRDILERRFEIVKKLDINLFQFSTFRVGTVLDAELIEREEYLLNTVGVVEGVESIKKHINRELGKAITEVYGKKYDPDSPDMEIIFHTQNEMFQFSPSPVYIYGRYLKFYPMPQSKWPCRYCKGRGCKKCDYTGRQWKETVEYYMADVLLPLFLGKETKLHAAGREDIDAYTLGNGRPFVIEVKYPRKRYIDVKTVEELINEHASGKISVKCLRFTDRKEVKVLKSERFPKTYRAVVRCRGGVEESELRKLLELKGVTVEQKTPLRILHRRSEKVRKRKVLDIRAKKLSEHTFELVVRAEAGLYIKELVSGDEGRTRPSVSEVLKKDCLVERLEILDVEYQDGCGS